MAESKMCAVCGIVFEKPQTTCRTLWARRRFCSQACKAEWQRGKVPWNKGLKQPRPKSFLPCRICGQPTRYHGTVRNSLFGKVHCDRPECVDASRALKNERIRQGQLRAIAEGRKTNAYGWKNVRTISGEEAFLTPWFVDLGWTPQHVVAVGTIGGFQLDFAHLDRLLYVEIDGTSHRAKGRRERDRHRDAVLAEHGWRGLRIAAQDVANDPARVKADILHWIALHS